MHDLSTTITHDSVAQFSSAVAAISPPPTPLTVPLSALSPLGAVLSGLNGQSVDVINDLTQGALYRFLPGVPPGPRTRTYALEQFPDTGTGNLGLPTLGLLPGGGRWSALSSVQPNWERG